VLNYIKDKKQRTQAGPYGTTEKELKKGDERMSLKIW